MSTDPALFQVFRKEQMSTYSKREGLALSESQTEGLHIRAHLPAHSSVHNAELQSPPAVPDKAIACLYA